MAIIESQFDTCETLIKQTEHFLKSSEGSSLFDKIEETFEELEDIFANIKIEIKQLPKEERIEYQTQLKYVKNEFSDLKTILEKKKTE